VDRSHSSSARLKPRHPVVSVGPVKPSPETPRVIAGREPRGPAGSRPGWLQALGLLALGALLCAPGCARTAQEEGAAPDVPTIVADVGKVTAQDLVDWLTVPGTIAAMPNEDVRVSALVPGRVMMLRVAEGDAVAAGQVVAEIDPKPLEDQKRQAAAAVLQARAALENAKLTFERTDRLFKRGIAAGKEVEDARAQQAAAEAGVETAAATLDMADRQLARAKVTSPITGHVIKRLVNVGEQVDGTAAQPLVEVANVTIVELAANVPSEHLAAVRLGQRVDVVSDAYRNRTFPGEVMAITPAVDPATNAALARIRVPNANAALKVGMFAQARIVVGERKHALTVPPSAVSRDQGGQSAVYVVANGVAQRTVVTTGLETQDAVEILSGVSEGQAVLTSGVHGLSEKARLGKAS
jgi:RND family efflux transporter MFP subunit